MKINFKKMEMTYQKGEISNFFLIIDLINKEFK
jgi:hypothetical protein